MQQGLKISVFGTFYPESAMAGNTTWPIAQELINDERVAEVTVYAQLGSTVPASLRSCDRFELIPIWRHNDPVSLIKALLTMLTQTAKSDVFIFNTYITAFGRSSVANATGILLPVVLSVMAQRPTIVYMHNFMESQDVTSLGYHPGPIARAVVRILEFLLIKGTKVVVPLKSQCSMMKLLFKQSPVQLLIPFLEPSGLLSISRPQIQTRANQERTGNAKILLLGRWGPQKDLKGILDALRLAEQAGADFSVTITGATNPNFLDYKGEVYTQVKACKLSHIKMLPMIPEEDMISQVMAHDLLILPYNASGGYSGAMMIGAYCGIDMIAYDLPQLRETASMINCDVTFVHKGETAKIADEIKSFCLSISRIRKIPRILPNPALDCMLKTAISQLTTLALTLVLTARSDTYE